MACVNVTDFVQQRQIGNYKYRRQKRHVESFLEEKGLTSLINKECSLSGHCRSTFNMEFSPDGTKVASTHGDHTVRVTDIATGKCVRTLTGHPRTPWCLAYHPSSSHILASGCLDGQVRIWDLYGQGCEVWQTERSTPIASLTFHPVDHVLVFASGKTIYFWDWGRPEPFAQCTTKLEYERVRWVKFDPLGHILYTGISNNTTAQRDEAARVSLINQRGENQPQRPERLSAMYNNLMNRFQEYRRDRVVNQVQPQLSRQPVQSTSSWDPVADAEMYPGVSDSDIVRPTSPGPAQMLNYARQYAAEVTHRAADSNIGDRISRSTEEEHGNFHSDTTSVPPVSEDLVVDFTTESVLNGWENSRTVFTNVDIEPPRLENHEVALNDMLGLGPDASDEATIELVINETEGNSAGINEHGLDIVGERVNASSAVVDNSDNRENQSAESTGSAERQGVLNRRGMWSPPPRRLSREELTGEVSGRNEGQLNLSNYRDRSPLTQRLGDNVISESDSGLLSREQECLNCRSKQDLNSNLQVSSGSSDPDRIRAATTALKIHPVSSVLAQAAQSLPSSTANTTASNFPVTPMLTRFLQSQKTPQNKASSSESKSSSVFPNIRERLQTNIPLTSSDGTHKTGPVRVLTSRGEIPVVTVVSASENSATVSSTIDTPRPTYLSRLQTSDTNLTTVRSGLSYATSNLNSLSSSHVSRSRLSASARGSEERELSLLNYPPIVPTVIASTSSHASLFQNIYHNSRGTYNYNTRGSFGGGGLIRNTTLTSSRTQPYLQSRSRYGSLMGPYLESRGVGLNRYLDMSTENSAIPNQNTSSVTSRPIIRMTPELNRVAYTENQSRLSQLGPPLSVLNSTTTQYNPLESSDTESELNTHLHNGRYFLPISEDQTRTVSSTSVQSASSVESSETLTTRQRSISRDSMENGVQGRTSVTDIPNTGNSASEDFVQDMHRLRRESILERMHLQNNESDLNEVALLNQDDNNNTIHMSENLTSSTQPREGPEPYLALRNNLVSMTDQIEQEMNELNRRINALRDSFNQSLQALRQDRERYQSLGQSLTDTSTNLLSSANTTRGDNPVRAENSGEQTNFPVIRVTGLEDSQRESNDGPTVLAGPEVGLNYPDSTLSQPPTLLETSLRSHTRQRQASTNYQPESLGDSNGNIEPQHWRMLHRHYLHPHYSSSILDETINRPNNAIQSAINRAIAGAFMGTGEAAVANNIINQTHRIQYWDFTKLDIPDITNANQNIVVPHCKLHNDASCDISQNGSLLATFVPSHQGFPDDNILAIYSLEPSSRGQCLYTKSFGPNAISISISPRNNFVMVGLAAKRLSWVFIRNQMVAQIYKFEKENAGEKSMKHVTDVIHPCDMDIRTHISGNAAKWLPTPGHGLVYGTNRGHLRLCRPFCMVGVDKNSGDKDSVTLSTGRGPVSRRNLLQMLGLSNSNLPRTISISTQTNIRGIRQSSGTQTDNSDSD